MVVTAGATNNISDIAAKLCRVLMNYIEWTPFKQYVVKNDFLLQVNDILLCFMPPDCGIFERDFFAILSDPVLPCDLDSTLSRFQWAILYPEAQIQDILSNRDGFNL
jgi:hypothetical protein